MPSPNSSNTSRVSGFNLKAAFINGGAAGALTVTGIRKRSGGKKASDPGDKLIGVYGFDSQAALLNQVRNALLNQALGNPGFQIRTNFDVQNANAISYTNAGTLKTLGATQAFDTGTSQVIATGGKWSAALLTVSAAGGATVTWSATLNAVDEATAIAALPAVPAGHTVLGYLTVQSAGGSTWTAGTDALAGGAGGTPAQATNYYNSVNPNSLVLGSAASAVDAADYTSEFSISADDTITNVGGTATTGLRLMVLYLDADMA